MHYGTIPALLVEEETGGAAALPVRALGVVGGQRGLLRDRAKELGPLVRHHSAVYGLEDRLQCLGRVCHLLLGEEPLAPRQHRQSFSQRGGRHGGGGANGGGGGIDVVGGGGGIVGEL